MYQYAPKPKKQAEKLICSLLLFLSAFCYAAPSIFQLAFPAAFQLVAFVSLAVSIFIASGYLLKSYVYGVEENPRSAVPDFTVTELRGKRRTVVCRISLDEIIHIEPFTTNNQKDLAQKNGPTQRFDYTATLSRQDVYHLTVMQHGSSVSVLILADEGLLQAIRRF